MKKYLALILISIVGGSCSTVGETNKIVKENISFVGGVDKEGKWDSALVFKRTSWFQKAQMVADILLVEIDESNPFSRWLGDTRQGMFDGCGQFYVALLYRNSFRTLSKAHLTGALNKKGLREISIPRFKENIMAHVTTNEMNFEHHKVIGFCSDKTVAEIKSIKSTIPGFQSIELL